MWKRILLGVAIALVLVLAAAGYAGYHYVQTVAADLPDVEALARYNPPTSTRVFASDGTLVAEFAAEKRIYTPISAIPKRVIDAFLAAEDRNFFEHGGLDVQGVARAMALNVKNLIHGRRLVGASTITQQVAKNLLLNNEVSLKRKVREALLAREIEAKFSKEKILELYLNAIFLGERSYGVAAAAETYFGKSLGQLSLAEAAYLAALPKAPVNYHPVKHHDRAVARRNWVLDRMATTGVAMDSEVEIAKRDPLKPLLHRDQETLDRSADDFIEEVRRQLLDRFGEDEVYQKGLIVHTTLDLKLQRAGVKALRHGLEAYDRSSGGYHGTRLQIAFNGMDWAPVLKFKAPPVPVEEWRVAVVVKATSPVEVGFLDGSKDGLSAASVDWARAGRGLKRGDVVFVEREGGVWVLRQAPDVNGALVSLDARDGRVRALVGGYSFATSSFNRATQAKRQPGSTFKPFVYAAALDAGYTPATIVYDAPITITGTGPMGLDTWSPANFDNRFMGAVSMRTGIELSRNTMAVRLARAVGMDKVVALARKFDISTKMEPVLANALGATETTPLKLANAYAMLANGGLRTRPIVIERVQDRMGKTLYRADDRPCPICSATWAGQGAPSLADPRERVMDAVTNYQLVNMMRGVVDRGTATSLRALGVPLAGKTGTTNDHKDAWFVGFTPDLVAAVYVGFDKPRPLGKGITGGEMSAPIFLEYAKVALADRGARDFTPPAEGVVFVNVDPRSGQPTADGRGVREAFRSGTEPGTQAPIVIGPDPSDPSGEITDTTIELTPMEDGSTPISAESPVGAGAEPTAEALPEAQ
jgi:penicillin-binding protein 1A